MNEFVNSLGYAKVFSELNTNWKYWTTPMAEEDNPHTALTCYKGFYYLGHVIPPGTLNTEEASTNVNKCLKRLNLPMPYLDLRSFLESCNMYRNFFRNYTDLTAPLLIEAGNSPPKLALPKLGFTYEIDTEACKQIDQVLTSKIFKSLFAVLSELFGRHADIAPIEGGVHNVLRDTSPTEIGSVF
eukprot:IDg20444t1